MNLYRATTTDTVTPEQTNQFLKFIEQNKKDLPQNLALNVVDALIVNLTSIMLKDDFDFTGRAITVFSQLLDEHAAVQSRYIPSKSVI